MAKFTQDELLEAFGEMTLVELSDFVKAFEEKFDVEAAAPVAAVAAAAPGAAPADTSSLPDISLSSSFQIRLPSLIHVKCRYHIFCFFYYDSLLLSLPDRYFMAKLLLSHHCLCFGICTCVYWLFTFQCTIPAVLSAHENTFWGIVKCAFID